MVSFNSMSSGMGAGGDDETTRVKRAAIYEKIDMFRSDEGNWLIITEIIVIIV